MKVRKQLSADSLFRLVRQKFGKIKEHRLMNVDIPLNDALMSAFALFSLKDSSLLAFDKQGYHFEHNFGHGKNHLSVIFAMLMMLAFAVDQAQQLACRLFQAAWVKAGSKRFLWEPANDN